MTSVMSIATAWAQYTIQIGSGFYRLCQALFTFNCQLVVTMYRVITEGCNVLYVLASLLVQTFVEIAQYIGQLLVEIGQFILICLGLLLDLLWCLLQVVFLAYSGLEVIVHHIAQFLLYIMQHAYSGLSSMCVRSGLSTLSFVTIKKFAYQLLVTFCGWLSQLKDDTAAVCGLVLSGIHKICSTVLTAISEAALTCVNGLVLFFEALGNVVSSSVTSVKNTVTSNISQHMTHEFQLIVLLTSLSVIMCMMAARSLHKRGLTFPWFLSHHILELEVTGEDDFIESDVDEENLVEEEENSEEEDGEVDEEEV